MFFLQKTQLLLILTYNFFGIRDGSSQDLPGEFSPLRKLIENLAKINFAFSFRNTGSVAITKHVNFE